MDCPPGVWFILGSGGGDGPSGPITTQEVLTIGTRPDMVNPFDGVPQTQQDANWYLHDEINQLDSDTYDKSQIDTFIANTIRLSNEGDADIRATHDLEAVLTAGNIADKNVVLTNAENDALLSPDEARIMVGGFGDDVVLNLNFIILIHLRKV